MKWFIIIVVLGISSVPLQAQVVVWDSLYWKKELVKINDALAMDSNFLFLGTGNLSYGNVFEMDRKGNILWDRITIDSNDLYWGEKYSHTFNFMEKKGNTLNLWGHTGQKPWAFNLLRYSIIYQGDFIDSARTYLEDTRLLNGSEDFYNLPNGNILMFSTDGSKTPPHISPDYYTAEYSSECKQLWKRSYFYRDSISLTKIQVRYSHDVISETGIWWHIPSYDSAETHITNFNLEGVIISQHQIPYRFAPFYYCMRVEPDGSIVMVGAHHNNLKNHDDRSYMMLRIDTAGHILTPPVDVGKYGIGSYGWVRYLRQTSDGGYMLAGVYENDDFDSVMYILKVDKDFKFVWKFERLCNRDGGFSHIQPVDSNTYLCTGLRYNQRMYAVMLRDEKAVQVSVKEEAVNAIEVYPNPVRDELYIKYGSVPSFIPLFVSVATMRGEMIELPAQRVAGDFFSVNVCSLEQGTYTALVNVGSRYKTVRFVVLR